MSDREKNTVAGWLVRIQTADGSIYEPALVDSRASGLFVATEESGPPWQPGSRVRVQFRCGRTQCEVGASVAARGLCRVLGMRGVELHLDALHSDAFGLQAFAA